MAANISAFEHLTHKSGMFRFCASFDEAVIAPKLAMAQVQYDTVVELPILPQLAAGLRRELIRRSIFGTAAIEGNPLGEDDVERLLDAEGSDPVTSRAELEVANLKKAYGLLEGRGESSETFEVTEEAIKGFHKTITGGLDYHHNSPGGYRNEVVKVGNVSHGGVYVPPKTLGDIRTLMGLFVQWINSEGVCGKGPLLRSALAHYHLAKIHPFQDGNGRVSRFLEAMILDRSGLKYVQYALSNYYYKHTDDYFIAFSESNKRKGKDVTPFLSFYFDALLSVLSELKGFAIMGIRLLSLKDYFHSSAKNKFISKRQRDLLLIMLSAPEKFSLDDLFSNVSLRQLYKTVSVSTARRDIKKLVNGNYLSTDEDGKRFWVNLRQLG